MEIKKKTIIYIGIALFVLLILIIGVQFTSFSILNLDENKNEGISKELAICIGENSVYYSQTGCPACVTQEDMFGDNIKYISKIDCKLDREKCIDAGIQATPTWIIESQLYRGVQTIEKLAELTGC
ncbi:hypothetical protein FJZ20_00270 [Candidatus Pacearchaeota archaeon]|nr:hypothetical protein [Candidatus Pacearchaeota archaeon]